MHTDSGIRSGNRAVRLGRGVWAAAALVDFIILLRVSALTESTWALGALLFGACALGVLWNRLFCSRACRGFFAVRSGAKIFSLVLILLFGAGSLAFCAMASPKALRLVLLTLLVAVQLFSLPLTERAESFSRKTRTVLLTVLHAALDALMLLLIGGILQRKDAGWCFGAYVLCGAALIACRNLPAQEEHALAAEEQLPASFSLWLQTVSADVMAAVFCGIAFTAEVSLRIGTPLTVLLLAAAALTGALSAARMLRTRAEYAVLQRRGIACWLAAVLLCLVWKNSVLPVIFVLPLFGLGCAWILCGLIAMREPFALLLADCSASPEETDVGDYLSAAVQGALLPAGLMLMAVLTAAVCFLPQNSKIVTPALALFSLATGAVFLVRSWLLTTRQPMDRAACAKIRRRFALADPAENPLLAERVQQCYVEPFTRSAGFWVVKTLFRPFFPSRFLGAENIDDASETPMVFVCNHLEIYGPIITQLHLPYPVRTWIINNMVDLQLTEENLSGAIDKIFRFFSPKMRRRLCHVLARPVCWAMNSIDHVTVYRGNSRDVIRTIRDTVDAIRCGDNILLFPENTSAKGETGAYKIGEVSAFFSGFSNIAASVYEKTGQCVTFYPLFADKKKKKIRAGKGITFDPSRPKAEEKKRIVTYLHDTMCSMAELAKKE
ncbi:MAG: hypothetical protein PUC59_06685 [Firmicutes bacterium]|nr:hypothetical protein [Bacillota bacterium]